MSGGPILWNYTYCLLILSLHSSDFKKLLIILMYQTEFTVAVIPFSSKKYGPMISNLPIAHLTATFGLCKYWKFCFFTECEMCFITHHDGCVLMFFNNISSISSAETERCQNPLRLTSKRPSFCKDGVPYLCVAFALLCFRSFLIQQHVAEQNKLDSVWWLLSLFPRSPEFLQFATSPGGFFFITVPLVRKDVTHLEMVCSLDLKCSHDAQYWNADERVSITDLSLFTKLPYTNIHALMSTATW